jgi:hypothetical protein
VEAGRLPAISPLLALLFCVDESQSGVQRPLPFPSEAECFKLFLTEELVGDILETNRYALGLQEKREPGVGGQPQLVRCIHSW